MKKICAALFAAFSLSGCVFLPYEQPNRFDLDVKVDGKAVKPAGRIVVREFSNRSGAGTPMQLRASGGRIFTDSGNKWALPPEELVPRAVNLALPPPAAPDAKVVGVDGSLTVFEASLADKKFILAGSFTAPRPDGAPGIEEFFRIETPLAGSEPEAIAKAAAEAVSLLAAKILQSAAGR